MIDWLLAAGPFYANGALDEWVECCKPDSNSLRRVMLGILEAIAHLHEQGIVHADVKPKNILMDSGPDPGAICGGCC